MKRSTVLRILTGLLVLVLVLGGCVAPGAAPAPAGDETATTSDDTSSGDAAALECTDEIGCVEIAPDEPIHVGYMLTISGATASLGEDSRGGIEIAIDDHNGELLGHAIELSGEDSGCSAEGGQTAAQKIAADSTVVGVIGTNCSSSATAALPIISQAGLVLISPDRKSVV